MENEELNQVNGSEYVAIPINVYEVIANYMGNKPWKEVDSILNAIKSVPTLGQFLKDNEVK